MRLQNISPMTTSDFLCTLEGLEGYFSEFSGVKFSVERPDWGDGLTTVKRKAASGVINFDDVTIACAFDPEKSGYLIEWAEEAKCKLETSDVTIRPVKRCNGIEQRGSKAWHLSGCRLKDFETFNSMNTNDGKSVVMIKYVLTVEEGSWG
jgi:hypothetical protein